MARYIHSGDQVKSEQIKAAASGTKGRPDDKSESSDELGALLKQGQSFPQAGAGPSAAESGGEESGRDVHPSYADSSGGPAEGTADAENSKQADIGVDAGVTGYSGHDLQPSDGAGTPDQEGLRQRIQRRRLFPVLVIPELRITAAGSRRMHSSRRTQKSPGNQRDQTNQMNLRIRRRKAAD